LRLGFVVLVGIATLDRPASAAPAIVPIKGVTFEKIDVPLPPGQVEPGTIVDETGLMLRVAALAPIPAAPNNISGWTRYGVYLQFTPQRLVYYVYQARPRDGASSSICRVTIIPTAVEANVVILPDYLVFATTENGACGLEARSERAVDFFSVSAAELDAAAPLRIYESQRFLDKHGQRWSARVVGHKASLDQFYPLMAFASQSPHSRLVAMARYPADSPMSAGNGRLWRSIAILANGEIRLILQPNPTKEAALNVCVLAPLLPDKSNKADLTIMDQTNVQNWCQNKVAAAAFESIKKLRPIPPRVSHPLPPPPPTMPTQGKPR
jgi:hypothetical protein